MVVQTLHARLQNAVKHRGATRAAAQELEADLAIHAPHDLAKWKDAERRWLDYVAANEALPKNIDSPYHMCEDKGVWYCSPS